MSEQSRLVQLIGSWPLPGNMATLRQALVKEGYELLGSQDSRQPSLIVFACEQINGAVCDFVRQQTVGVMVMAAIHSPQGMRSAFLAGAVDVPYPSHNFDVFVQAVAAYFNKASH